MIDNYLNDLKCSDDTEYNKRFIITIKDIKEEATRLYNEGGHRVIECWTDEDIQNYIDEGNDLFDLYNLLDMYSGL